MALSRLETLNEAWWNISSWAMNPALGLGELNENQLGASGTYFMVDLTFRMRSIAA